MPKQQKDEPNIVRVQVRLPLPVYERLVMMAKAHHRSANGEIVQAVEEHLNRDEENLRGREEDTT